MEAMKDLRLAVLIDADNVPHTYVKGMLEEIAKYGTPTFKRIYGDWTRPTAIGWKSVLLQNAITPIQQYSYTTGKNSSDSALIIDAMDILYTGRVDGFCIVSSDSDFTRLATRLREAGMKVFGLGEKKTPTAFISACNKFIYIEILKEKEDPIKQRLSLKNKKKVVPVPQKKEKPSIGIIDTNLIQLVSDSIMDIADENGWAFLGDLGNLILKKQPDFDPRNFGFKKLYPLIKSLNITESEERSTGKNNITLVFVRLKS
jgi:hypothetical protein